MLVFLFVFVLVFVFVSISVFVLYQAGSLVYHCLDASFVCICAPPDGKLVEINGSPAIKTKLCFFIISILQNLTNRYQVLCLLLFTSTNIEYLSDPSLPVEFTAAPGARLKIFYP